MGCSICPVKHELRILRAGRYLRQSGADIKLHLIVVNKAKAFVQTPAARRSM